jgi:hypothetical protein
MNDYWSHFGDIVWWSLTFFFFISYLIALFSIVTDLVRDRTLGGGAKALWLLFLVFLPFLTALAYLLFRGRGMSDRSADQQRKAQAAVDDHIRSVAGGPAEEISKAKALLDSGAISAEEYARIKSAALASLR